MSELKLPDGKQPNSRSVLVEYRVRILGPAMLPWDYPSNEIMDDALRTIEASLEYRGNLRKIISRNFVDGIDSLGCQGFVVDVERIEE
jgi:hypothetical protein